MLGFGSAELVEVVDYDTLGVVVLKPKGHSFDFSTAKTMRAALGEGIDAHIAAGRRRFILDLTDVKVWDSGALAVLVALHKHLHATDARMGLAIPEDKVRLFEVTKLDKVFSLFTDMNEARLAV